MFGHDSQPSKIYSYGAKEPVANAERVFEQMQLAHKYRNRLVELERSRRARVDEALARLSPELVDTEKALSGAEVKLEEARAVIRKASADARTKKRPPEAVAAVKEWRDRLKELRAKRKSLRMELFSSPAWEAEQENVNGWVTGEQHRLRAECGLYWGTYLHVEQSMSGARSGAPPRFQRWEGDGHLAVQIQGGIAVAEAFGSDNRVRIEPLPTEGSKSARKKTRVHFRVGSDENGNPIFTVVPVMLHRPLAEDAKIKWVHLIRRRIATQCEWRVQFVLSRETGWARPDSATDGTVGIDVGWRLLDDGSLRVAYWVGSDGDRGQLVLPPDWLQEMKKTRDIRSIRDRNFDEVREKLAAWLRNADPHLSQIPQWLKDATASLSQWKSEARLAALVLKWRESRFEGDAGTFEALEAWRKRDKHLYEYEGNLRDQLQRRREDLYRVFVAKLRRKYKTAHIEELDLRDFHELPEAEEDAAQGALREHTRDACLSFLTRRAIKESMSETFEIPAPDTTRACHSCGSIEEWDRRILTHKCSSCGVEYDQDENAAINLLKATPKKIAIAPVT